MENKEEKPTEEVKKEPVETEENKEAPTEGLVAGEPVEGKPKTQTSEEKPIVDEYAEVPEKILDEKDLEELKEMEKESETKEEKEKIEEKRKPKEVDVTEDWHPKTRLGEEVKSEKIKNIDEILESGRKIMEEEIVDSLINVKSDLIAIGQSKGKFGGGKRRVWRQTQRKTKEGNVPTFSAMAVTGDGNGHIGIGSGKSMETLPARDKAIRKSKLNIIQIRRACAAFDCDCSELHTIPFKVTGKSGSVRVTFIPAPQGTGLVIANELKKVLKLAGIKDIYSRTSGRARTTFNLIKACIDALKKTNMKLNKQ